MSLLLEALKKAERAKEEAQRRAKGGDAGANATGPGADPNATVAIEAKHITTRDELPDISAPLEILSDDLRAAPSRSSSPLELVSDPVAPTAPEPRPASRREPAARGSAASADPANAERAAAQRVFEAKFKEPNPRLPFYITVGVLGTFAIGTVVYFWLQLRPAPSLVNANPPRSASEKIVDTPAPAAAPGQPGSQAASPAAPASAIPGLPASAPESAPAAAPAAPAATPTKPAAAPVAAAATAVEQAAKPAARAQSPRGRASAESPDERSLSINRGTPQIHPQVQSGYAAYQADNLAAARSDYQQVLRDEPANRDALLGLAAVEMRSGRHDLADAYYRRVLQMDPRDPHAQAGMLALRGQQLDPVVVESRLKSLLSTERESNVLYFTLGNQYAAQGRWAEAQQAYFKAFAIDPDNPDFAFNLAVSLDQLRQPKLALEYYRRALALSAKRSSNFALDLARARVEQLSR
jgi:tetratricopeptide (TPR) repeat protein